MNSNNTDGNESGSLIQKWIDLTCRILCSECDMNMFNTKQAKLFLSETCSVWKARDTEMKIEEQMRVMYPKIFAKMRGEE